MKRLTIAAILVLAGCAANYPSDPPTGRGCAEKHVWNPVTGECQRKAMAVSFP